MTSRIHVRNNNRVIKYCTEPRHTLLVHSHSFCNVIFKPHNLNTNNPYPFHLSDFTPTDVGHIEGAYPLPLKLKLNVLCCIKFHGIQLRPCLTGYSFPGHTVHVSYNYGNLWNKTGSWLPHIFMNYFAYRKYSRDMKIFPQSCSTFSIHSLPRLCQKTLLQTRQFIA